MQKHASVTIRGLPIKDAESDTGWLIVESCSTQIISFDNQDTRLNN